MGNGFGFAPSRTLTDVNQITERENALANHILAVFLTSTSAKANHSSGIPDMGSSQQLSHLSHLEACRHECFIAWITSMPGVSQDVTNIFV